MNIKDKIKNNKNTLEIMKKIIFIIQYIIKIIKKIRLNNYKKKLIINEYEYLCYKSQFLGKNFKPDERYFIDRKDVEKVKHIAFYLPQFHTIPENDKWWGKNFTEWNNVVKTIPQFIGHNQPHLPYDLGFYNLLDSEIWKQQINIAKNYGLYGFCFYFYWFNGKRLLEKPIDLFLNSKELDFPFCFFWANDSWVRTWHGFSDFERGDRILLEQNHNTEDDINVMNYLLHNVFKDERYIKINGKPLFIIYHTHLFNDIIKTIDMWRKMCKKHFKDIFLLHVMMPGQENNNAKELGFDGKLQFSPIGCSKKKLKVKIISKYYEGVVYDYSHLVEEEISRKFKYADVIRGCFPTWDNEGRKPAKGICYHNYSSELFKRYLIEMNKYALKHKIENESFVFLNAWNEWAEGAHLEPDREYGYTWLNVIAEVINNRKER